MTIVRSMPRLADLANEVSSTHAFKVVVTGPVGVGKTTFINTISEMQTIATEAHISDGTATAAKPTTTVGIDFGRIVLAGGLDLYLFGTPGQQRFDFVWDITSRGMLGVIVLLDCERPETFRAGLEMLEYFRARGDVPAIIAANKVTDFNRSYHEIVSTLQLSEHDFVVPTNALDRRAVKATLIELLELIVARFL